MFATTYEGSRVDVTVSNKRRLINMATKQHRHYHQRQQQHQHQTSANICSKQQVVAIGDAFSARTLFIVTGLSILLIGCLMGSLVAAISSNEQPALATANAGGGETTRALEAELNSIVQQHEGLDGNSKQLAEAIISRFMLDNLTGAGLSNLKGDLMDNDIASDLSGDLLISPYSNIQQQQQQQVSDEMTPYTGVQTPISGPDALRSKKLLSLWQNYGSSLGTGLNGGQALVPFPELPASEAATMKRTVNYLQQQQQRHHYGPRNNFDFGLGKRPDSGLKSNILRFGDGAMGQVPQVGQFGKRPSAHRFDFGLGKRVASPAYPRYDFGLGKRAPNRIRYDFGLGRK